MRKLDKTKTDEAANLLSQGCSLRSVANKVGIHYSTVSRLRENLRRCGQDVENGQSGRPRLFNSRQERNYIRMVATGRCSTAVQLQRTITGELGNHAVSVATCKRILNRAGFHGRRKLKKPLLSKTHRKQRFAFAKSHRKWRLTHWKRVVWSDESKFNLYGSDGTQYCWRREGEPLQDHHVKPTVKHGGGSVMVWGCFSWQGVGSLTRIEGIMTAQHYQTILANELLRSFNLHHLNKSRTYFQHDNDPKHKARSTQAWLASHGIRVLSWPPQSPDMNPIEHLWNYLDRRLRQRPVLPTSLDELWQALKDEWEKIPVSFCRDLIATMPERVADLRKAHGSHTRW